MRKKQNIFDGHNDLLLRLWLEKDYNGKSFFQSTRVGNDNGHLDLKSAKSGGFVGGFFAIFVAAAFCQFQGVGLTISLNDLVISMTMGVVQAGAGLIFYTLGSRSVPAAELALLSMSEVVLGPIWAWLFIGETASIYTLVGGSVLLSAIVANALTGLRRKPTPLI